MKRGEAGKAKLGVIIPCHNDARYLRRCLASIKAAAASFDSRILVVIDRCTDDSLDVTISFGVEPIVKDSSAWRNSTAENLNIGFLRLLERDYVGVIAADTVLPGNYFLECLEALKASPQLTSVSGLMFTERSTFFNSLYSSYETLLERRGLHHGIRGSGRVYRMAEVRHLYQTIGKVIDDVLAEDSFLDERLGGARRVLTDVSCFCIRESGVRKSAKGQFTSGMARRQLGLSLRRLLGELARLRFFVILGFLLYPLVRDPRADSEVAAVRLASSRVKSRERHSA